MRATHRAPSTSDAAATSIMLLCTEPREQRAAARRSDDLRYADGAVEEPGGRRPCVRSPKSVQTKANGMASMAHAPMRMNGRASSGRVRTARERSPLAPMTRLQRVSRLLVLKRGRAIAHSTEPTACQQEHHAYPVAQPPDSPSTLCRWCAIRCRRWCRWCMSMNMNAAQQKNCTAPTFQNIDGASAAVPSSCFAFVLLRLSPRCTRRTPAGSTPSPSAWCR